MNVVLYKMAGRRAILTLNLHGHQSLTILWAGIQTKTEGPRIAVKHPFKVDVISGKLYSWCACGHSKKQPFCDGSHKKLSPEISPLRFTADKDGSLLLCGCKHTSSAPYCDGTHKQDFIQKAQLSSLP